MQRGLAITAAVVAGLAGCGGAAGRRTQDPGSERDVAAATTARPELAFFTTHGNAVYDLGLTNDRGRRFKVLRGEVTPALFTNLSWSPSGRRLAFAGRRGKEPSDWGDIFTIKANGFGVRRITHGGNAADPLWSPDGRTLVFTRYRAGQRSIRGSLWSVGADGSGLTEIAPAQSGQIYTAGSFAPDGSRLAVTRASRDLRTGRRGSEIDVMHPDGSDRRRLVKAARDPAYSPDGRRIAFASYRDHNGRLCYGDFCFWGGELYRARSDGSHERRLTRTRSLNEAHPSWLPDGARLAYQRGKVFQNAEAMSILEINPGGSCPRKILAGAGPAPWFASPAWRPTKARRGGGRLDC